MTLNLALPVLYVAIHAYVVNLYLQFLCSASAPGRYVSVTEGIEKQNTGVWNRTSRQLAAIPATDFTTPTTTNKMNLLRANA